MGDVECSLAYHLDVLGPLGLKEEARYPSYRGTEESSYLSFGDEWLGLRPAGGGEHRYYEVGLEHPRSKWIGGMRWTMRIGAADRLAS